jgi:2-iminobutanoate/2-iminopropanoate deaminase
MARETLGSSEGKPYSPGTKMGNLIFVSGQLARDANGKLVAGGAAAETRQCIENIKSVLAEAGAMLEHVMMVNVYLTDMGNDYATMNQVYMEYFTKAPPARATVEVSKLAMGAKVEISAIAAL